jgi:hypothetical protein
MDRRDFLFTVVKMTLVAPAAGSLLACSTTTGDDDDSSTPTAQTPTPSSPGPSPTPTATQPTCTLGDASGPSESHGHNLMIPQADIASPADRTYTSSGGTHNHTVSVTAAELTTLRDTCTVTVSSNDTHPHTWILEIA